MSGLDEASAGIAAVRGKFERQLLRLRERERLVEISRQDCEKEEEALQVDRESHRSRKEKVIGYLGWLVGLSFLMFVSYVKPVPTHHRIVCCGNMFNLIFLGLGWPWIVELVVFIVIFACLSTQYYFVNRKHLLTWLVDCFF